MSIWKRSWVKNGQELKEILLAKTADLDFGELAKDLEPFLINSEDSKKVKLFREYLVSLRLN